MFIQDSLNDFDERFDFFKWSAPYYENPQEVFNALDELNLKGKVLVAINAIGACRDVGRTKGIEMYETIRNAGIEPGDNWLEDYPHMDEVRIPQSIVLCEPIQFVFDDASTLEILPIEDGGARIATNSIPIGMINGLNDGEIDASAFFAS